MNPTSKPTDTRVLRVFRGGSWYSGGPSWVLVASRDARGPAIRGGSLGFRCALRGREPRTILR